METNFCRNKNNIRRVPIKTVLVIHHENCNAFSKDLYFWAHRRERMMQPKRGEISSPATMDYNGRTTVSWELFPISLPTSTLIQEYFSLINENKSVFFKWMYTQSYSFTLHNTLSQSRSFNVSVTPLLLFIC